MVAHGVAAGRTSGGGEVSGGRRLYKWAEAGPESQSGSAQCGKEKVNKNMTDWAPRLDGPNGLGCAEIKEKSFSKLI
jgi:hypothetical protein